MNLGGKLCCDLKGALCWFQSVGWNLMKEITFT